jgi:hypothetical protein
VAEATLSTRLSQIEAVIRSADHQFITDVNNSIRLIVIHRLFQSTERRAELNFLSNSIVRVLAERFEGSAEYGEAGTDLASTFENLQNESNGTVFSAVTDFLDRMSARELYRFAEELRNEPIHCD